MLLISVPIHASALSLVCTDNIVTGADWENGAWKQETYLKSTYTMSDSLPESLSATRCLADASSNEGFDVVRDGVRIVARYTCFTWARMGEEPIYNVCKIIERDGVVTYIDCEFSWGSGDLRVIPNGEMLRTSYFSHPEPYDPDHQRRRDSVYLALGHCNVVG